MSKMIYRKCKENPPVLCAGGYFYERLDEELEEVSGLLFLIESSSS